MVDPKNDPTQGGNKSDIPLRKKAREPHDGVTSEHSSNTDGVQPDERVDPDTGEPVQPPRT